MRDLDWFSSSLSFAHQIEKNVVEGQETDEAGGICTLSDLNQRSNPDSDSDYDL